MAHVAWGDGVKGQSPVFEKARHGIPQCKGDWGHLAAQSPQSPDPVSGPLVLDSLLPFKIPQLPTKRPELLPTQQAAPFLQFPLN